MLILASQAFANGTWTITPEEPATLPLALVGFGTLAVYAVLTGWRPRRSMLDVDTASRESDVETTEWQGDSHGQPLRRAA